MGPKLSKEHHHHGHHGGEDQATPQAAAATPAAAATVTADPPLEKYDVVVSCTSDDGDVSLAQLISDRLKDTGMSVFVGSGESADVVKQASKLVVYTKCMVYVASKEAAKRNVGQDLMSLAYISNKPIVVAAREPKADLMKLFAAGMKMTLNQLLWVVFENKEEDDLNVKSLIQHIQEATATKTEETAPAAPTAGRVSRRGARLNTKLKAQSTVKDIGGEDLMIDNFWDRNFPSEEEVEWQRFEECFRKDYEAQLSRLFEAENIPWLINMLKGDVFENREKITKELFFSVRGDSVERNAFWKVVSQIAVEKFNMREVFDMNSSVRLTAIERLSAFQNPAVVEALLNLLEDEDPNVRAVAAISLGRTGTTDETVVDRLIGLLKDQDRIVRQSACLSLGTMKAVKAIPHIGNIWRNDFISVVRNAARTALENMKIPEAQEVLSVTKVLEEEIAALEGSQAIV